MSVREEIEARLKKAHSTQSAIDATLALCDHINSSEQLKGAAIRIEESKMATYVRVHVDEVEIAIDPDGHYIIQFDLQDVSSLLELLYWTRDK